MQLAPGTPLSSPREEDMAEVEVLDLLQSRRIKAKMVNVPGADLQHTKKEKTVELGVRHVERVARRTTSRQYAEPLKAQQQVAVQEDLQTIEEEDYMP